MQSLHIFINNKNFMLFEDLFLILKILSNCKVKNLPVLNRAWKKHYFVIIIILVGFVHCHDLIMAYLVIYSYNKMSVLMSSLHVIFPPHCLPIYLCPISL